MSLETNPSHPVNPLGHRLPPPPPGLSHHVKASLGRRDSIMVSPSETYPLDSQNTTQNLYNHFIICRSRNYIPPPVRRSINVRRLPETNGGQTSRVRRNAPKTNSLWIWIQTGSGGHYFLPPRFRHGSL
ncbi:unnamed protein product [Boreogadus saida]